MCELFGICSEEKISCNQLLNIFYKDSVHHPDGWGLAVFRDDIPLIEKEPLAAHNSMYLKFRLEDEIREDILLAHIRRASVGKLSYKNSHPFTQKDDSGRNWTLEHNGTIFESAELEPFAAVQNGQSDSERILLYLVHQMNKAMKERGTEELTAQERFQVVDQVIHTIAPKNKINLLIYDGDLFYVHTNHPDSLYSSRRGDTLIFCTRPLDEKHWDKVPLNTLMAFHKGMLVYTGQEHDHIYLKEEEIGKVFDALTSPNIYYL